MAASFGLILESGAKMKLPALFSFMKAAPVRAPGDTPRSPLGIWRQEKRAVVEYSNVVAGEKALSHPIVFRALHKLASSVQQVKWYAEPDPDVAASQQAGAAVIKSLNDMLASPNDTMAAPQLRYWMALSYAVYGRVPFKVGVGATKLPNAIYPLDPRWVTLSTDARGQIKGYEYGSNASSDKKELLMTRRQALRDDSGKSYAYEIYTPNLAASLESGKNVTALGAIGLPTEVIEMLLRRAYDTASGHPNTKYIITAEKTLTEKQKTAIKDHMENAGPEGDEAGNILFLFNTEIKVHKLDNDLSDIHSKMPLDDMARMIYGAFGIPISLVGMGAADGAKFAGNYKESRQSFWEDTLIPGYLSPIATGLTAALCPYGARISFDLDSIDAIQDSRAARMKEINSVTFLTDDEKREIAGFAPLSAAQKAELAAARPAPKAAQAGPEALP